MFFNSLVPKFLSLLLIAQFLFPQSFCSSITTSNTHTLKNRIFSQQPLSRKNFKEMLGLFGTRLSNFEVYKEKFLEKLKEINRVPDFLKQDSSPEEASQRYLTSYLYVDWLILAAAESVGLPNEVSLIAAEGYGRKESVYPPSLDLLIFAPRAILTEDFKNKLQSFRLLLEEAGYLLNSEIMPDGFWVMEDFLKAFNEGSETMKPYRFILMDIRQIGENPNTKNTVESLQKALEQNYMSPSASGFSDFLSDARQKLVEITSWNVGPDRLSEGDVYLKKGSGMMDHVTTLVRVARIYENIVDFKDSIAILERKKFFTNSQAAELRASFQFYQLIFYWTHLLSHEFSHNYHTFYSKYMDSRRAGDQHSFLGPLIGNTKNFPKNILTTTWRPLVARQMGCSLSEFQTELRKRRYHVERLAEAILAGHILNILNSRQLVKSMVEGDEIAKILNAQKDQKATVVFRFSNMTMDRLHAGFFNSKNPVYYDRSQGFLMLPFQAEDVSLSLGDLRKISLPYQTILDDLKNLRGHKVKIKFFTHPYWTTADSVTGTLLNIYESEELRRQDIFLIGIQQNGHNGREEMYRMDRSLMLLDVKTGQGPVSSLDDESAPISLVDQLKDCGFKKDVKGFANGPFSVYLESGKNFLREAYFTLQIPEGKTALIPNIFGEDLLDEISTVQSDFLGRAVVFKNFFNDRWLIYGNGESVLLLNSYWHRNHFDFTLNQLGALKEDSYLSRFGLHENLIRQLANLSMNGYQVHIYGSQDPSFFEKPFKYVLTSKKEGNSIKFQGFLTDGTYVFEKEILENSETIEKLGWKWEHRLLGIANKRFSSDPKKETSNDVVEGLEFLVPFKDSFNSKFLGRISQGESGARLGEAHSVTPWQIKDWLNAQKGLKAMIVTKDHGAGEDSIFTGIVNSTGLGIISDPVSYNPKSEVFGVIFEGYRSISKGSLKKISLPVSEIEKRLEKLKSLKNPTIEIKTSHQTKIGKLTNFTYLGRKESKAGDRKDQFRIVLGTGPEGEDNTVLLFNRHELLLDVTNNQWAITHKQSGTRLATRSIRFLEQYGVSMKLSRIDWSQPVVFQLFTPTALDEERMKAIRTQFDEGSKKRGELNGYLQFLTMQGAQLSVYGLSDSLTAVSGQYKTVLISKADEWILKKASQMKAGFASIQDFPAAGSPSLESIFGLYLLAMRTDRLIEAPEIGQVWNLVRGNPLVKLDTDLYRAIREVPENFDLKRYKEDLILTFRFTEQIYRKIREAILRIQSFDQAV
jgi:hypothetical protein